MTELPVAAVICVAVASLLMAGVFAMLHVRERQPGLLWFAGAWTLEAVRHLLSITPDTAPSFFAGVLVFGAAVLALIEGSFRFASRPPSRVLRVAVAAMLVWQSAVFFWGPSFVIWHLPVSVFITVTRLVVARMLWAGGGPLLGRGVATVSMALWALHASSYPFLANVPSAAPWGFGVSALLGLSTALGVVMAYFERAREETDASEARLRSVFDGASDGIATLDGEGRVLTANPALARLLGLASPAALEGERLADLARRQRPFDDATGDGVETWRRPDGEARLVSVSISKAPRGEGERVHVFVRDVTREARLQNELEEVRRLEAIGRLAGGVAHDFNNLLQIMSSAIQLAARTPDAEKRRENLAIALDTSSRGAELTRQLLAVGRRQTVDARYVDLGAVLRDFGEWVGRLLGDDVTLELDLDGAAHGVSADRGQLERILVNLVTNARDAMPDGGRIRVRLRGDGDAVVLSVEDEGSGMDEATRSRIFEPFFTTKELGHGTGLGLATVHGIATQHGWALDVDSEPGRGTRFTLRLPSAAPERDRSAEVVLPPSARSGRVLLVDDDATLLLVSAELLRDAGYEVHARAPEDVHAGEPGSECDVLVTDVSMRAASGPELAARARTLEPRLPVVFVSGYAADARISLDARTAFVAKPFHVDDLVSAIESVRAAGRDRSDRLGRARDGSTR